MRLLNFKKGTIISTFTVVTLLYCKYLSKYKWNERRIVKQKRQKSRFASRAAKKTVPQEVCSASANRYGHFFWSGRMIVTRYWRSNGIVFPFSTRYPPSSAGFPKNQRNPLYVQPSRRSIEIRSRLGNIAHEIQFVRRSFIFVFLFPRDFVSREKGTSALGASPKHRPTLRTNDKLQLLGVESVE